MGEPRRLWSDFSFVVSSSYRERVFKGLGAKPKLPRQLSDETGLRIAHVSRALRELSDRGLAECLTPEAKAIGRLYGLTTPGFALLAELQVSSTYVPTQAAMPLADRFIPKIRGSSVWRVLEYLRRTRGAGVIREALRDWSVDSDAVAEESWLSADAVGEFLDLLEKRFGDGSYAFVRRSYADAVASFPSVREQLLMPIPLRVLAERAPIVYTKEWNYGRLVVRAEDRRASFLHYDWQPTAAMCAMYHGVYEGILRGRHTPGTVTKTRCLRAGDDHCEYLVEW